MTGLQNIPNYRGQNISQRKGGAWHLYSSAKAAITKSHKLGSMNIRDVFSQSVGARSPRPRC